MYKKAWWTCKVVVLLVMSKPVAFLPFSLPLPSPSSLHKLPSIFSFSYRISICAFSLSLSVNQTCSVLCLRSGVTSDWFSESNFTHGTTNQKPYPDLGSDTSSVWNFCACFLHVISRGNRWWRRKISAVFPGYLRFANWNTDSSVCYLTDCVTSQVTYVRTR